MNDNTKDHTEPCECDGCLYDEYARRIDSGDPDALIASKAFKEKLRSLTVIRPRHAE